MEFLITILIILGVLFVIILFVWILVIICEANQRKRLRLIQQETEELNRQAFENRLKQNTWKFPSEKFGKKCRYLDFQVPLDSSVIDKANNVIIEILNSYNVPSEYHHRYIGEEKILLYYQQYEKIETHKIIGLLQSECKNHNLATIDDEASYQKALVILDNVIEKANIYPERASIYKSREKVESIFFAAFKKIKKKEEQKNKNILKQLRQEEEAYSRECLIGIEFDGKEKSIQHCKQMIALHKQALQVLDNQLHGRVEETAKRSMDYEQVDNNWAVHGGIASAIAGPVAGAVMAADAKQRIDQRNAKNAELSNLNMQLLFLDAQEIKAKQKKEETQLKKWEKKLENVKYAMEERKDPNYLLSILNPTIENCTVTKTGAVKLKLMFSKSNDLKIYEKKPAFIDGSIKVILKKNGKVRGTAFCCLPYLGTSQTCYANCICTETTNPDGKYDISFEPNRLWVQEKV